MAFATIKCSFCQRGDPCPSHPATAARAEPPAEGTEACRRTIDGLMCGAHLMPWGECNAAEPPAEAERPSMRCGKQAGHEAHVYHDFPPTFPMVEAGFCGAEPPAPPRLSGQPSVRRFRKKPVVIEAIQYRPHENCAEVKAFVGLDNEDTCEGLGSEAVWIIPTLEGDMHASPGDWIIKGVKGEFCPIKPDIFEETYEAAD